MPDVRHQHIQVTDLAFFFPRDQESLNTLTSLCTVNHILLDVTRPVIMQTLHLLGAKGISAFTSHNIRVMRNEVVVPGITSHNFWAMKFKLKK